MKNRDLPAFPIDVKKNADSNTNGLTKREYFAAMAMQGILACASQLSLGGKPTDKNPEVCIQAAIQYADELLKQLES